ncbi:PQQ-binding-like beta-propeller repeat protein [Stieleria sp. TO1_6]|uniref:outer membrane protein assembly factor BamB family protein n=1 Tax=Stieleria tagensis TaxID=2956795 RepID=UPI00209B9EFC|nr:PQQ-binding-like beta-propeller repeat protein [Stieleria tagensis]MCO8124293.1 PQQ-binding-like beta-propeller repeat protein [Stieleria tagensis]
MRNHLTALVLPAILTLSIGASAVLSADDSTTWPQWRGAQQDGVAPGATYPQQWSENSAIGWKLALPGRGGSTPVVADGKAFLTAGVDDQNTLIAIDINSGKQLWATALGADRGNKHKKGSGSNPSAVTDGESVFAYFRSGDLACVDFQGGVRWKINLQEEYGEDTLWWDLGSSPTVIGDLVVVAVMQSGPSYLVALDRKSGQPVWKTDRMLGAPEEAAQSYATPIAIPSTGQIAVMGADHLTIHSASDGRELGRVGGFNPNQEKFFRSIASPVVQGDLIVCPYSRGADVTTCRISDVVKGLGRDSIAWYRDDLGSDVPTPAVQDGRVYFTGDGKQSRGTISAVALETGKTIWEVQLPKSRVGFSSSPLVAGNHLYVTAEDATTYVIGPLNAEQPELVQTNELADNDQYTVASPVPVGQTLLLRTRHNLYQIAQ